MQTDVCAVIMLTSPRWYEPDQVPRVKKLQRVSFSAHLIGLPQLLLIQFTLSIQKSRSNEKKNFTICSSTGKSSFFPAGFSSMKEIIEPR